METSESTEPREESFGIDEMGPPEERLRDEAVAFSNCFWVCWCICFWYEDMAWSGRLRSKFCWKWLAATLGSTFKYSIEPAILMLFGGDGCGLVKMLLYEPK